MSYPTLFDITVSGDNDYYARVDVKIIANRSTQVEISVSPKGFGEDGYRVELSLPGIGGHDVETARLRAAAYTKAIAIASRIEYLLRSSDLRAAMRIIDDENTYEAQGANS